MMKRATVDVKAFSEALEKVSGVLKKFAIPVLSEVLVRFEKGKCTLTATDLNTWIIAETSCMGDDFSFVLQNTKDMVKACKLFRGELELALNESGCGRNRILTLSMNCENRSAVFGATPPEEYPEIGTIENETEFSIGAKTLLKRVERVGYAAKKPTDKDAARSCSIQFAEHCVYALDGLRLACDTDESYAFPKPFMVYAEPFSYLKYFGDEEVTVRLGKRRGTITGENMSMVFRLSGVDFYDVKQANPNTCIEEFLVTPKELIKELKYLKEFAKKDSRPYVRFCGGELAMPTSDGKFKTYVRVEGKSEITFAFNLHLMMDAMLQFRDEPKVKVKVSSAVTPFIIEAEGRSDYALICPTRLSEKLLAA